MPSNIEFKIRSDQLGSEAAMAWKNTDTGERGVLFRMSAEWYDEVLRLMQDHQEEILGGYEHFKSWPERSNTEK